MAGHFEKAARFSHHTFALIVGITDYAGKGLVNLPACAQEAIALEATLIDPSGCAIPPHQVIRIPDEEVSAQRIVAELAALCADRTADDTLVIYLAGHGAVREGEFIFLTGAADPSPGLEASFLDRVLAPVAARGVLLIADCCGGADIATHAPAFFRTPNQKEFRLFVSASRAGQSSWELSDLRNSLFTHRLLEVLSGRVTLGNRGEIYYADLYQYLHAAVQEDAQKYLGDRNRQEPVAIGIQVGDPLLFLHRDQTLSRVRVNTKRLTNEYLRRRVTVVVSTLLAAVGLALAGYWAFLDGHQFLHLADKVTLVHGYPGLSGFRLPHDDWLFDFGADAVDPSSALAREDVVLPRGRNALDVLGPMLRPGPRALLLSWQGYYAQSMRVLLERTGSSSNRDAQRALDFLPLKGYETTLSEHIPQLHPDDQIAAILSLARVDSERSIQAFQNSAIRNDAGYELDLLASWSAPCSPGVQTWLDDVTQHADRLRASTIALATVLAGCHYPANLIGHDAGGEDSVSALRLMKTWAVQAISLPLIAEVEDLAALGKSASRNPSRLRATPDQTLLALQVSRQLEDLPCFENLFDVDEARVFRDQAEAARLAIVEVVVKGCSRYRVHAKYEHGFFVLTIDPGNPELSRTLGFSATLNLFPALDMAIRLHAAGVAESIENILRDLPLAAQVRIGLIDRLAYLQDTTFNPLPVRVLNQPLLDVAIAQLLAVRNGSEASSFLRSLCEEAAPSVELIESLAFVRLSAGDRGAVLNAIRHYPPQQRTTGITLIGTPEQVAEQLTDAQPAVRAWAATYAPLRDDWNAIEKLAGARMTYPDPAIAQVLKTRVELARVHDLVSGAPEWARAWLVRRLGELRMNNPPAVRLYVTKLRQTYSLQP